MRTICRGLLLFAGLSVVTAAAEPPADLILRGGRVISLEEKFPKAEAIAIRGDKIAAVGTDAQIARLEGPQTRVIDLQGKCAVPGFVEGHGHFLSLGRSQMELQLGTARNWTEIVALVKQAAAKAKPGQWIVGRGWHQSKWNRVPQPNVQGYPVHTELSRISPNNPVLLVHASGHMSFVNAAAMKRAGITSDSKNPSGGEILRTSAGEPTGVLRETAQGLIHRALQDANKNRTAAEVDAEFREMVRLAAYECVKHGVTSFQDAGSSFAAIDRLRQMAKSGRLPVRLWMMIRAGNQELACRLPDYDDIKGEAGGFFTVGGIKRSIDGALGAHGAWLLEPYDDLPESRGLNTASLADLRRTGELALAHRLQFCVHAIGDRANRETLDLFEPLLRRQSEKDLRWRIEHAQHLHPDDIPRFAKLGVIASMQAVHCTSDAPFVIDRLGKRRAKEGAYAWRSLLDAGAVISNGTDVPVESIDPIACFYAAVTRKLHDGSRFFPAQCMTRSEALRSYIEHAAWAAFEEKQKGTLAPGKYADVVVLSGDLLSLPEPAMKQTRVVYTIVGGKVVYEALQNGSSRKITNE